MISFLQLSRLLQTNCAATKVLSLVQKSGYLSIHGWGYAKADNYKTTRSTQAHIALLDTNEIGYFQVIKP